MPLNQDHAISRVLGLMAMEDLRRRAIARLRYRRWIKARKGVL